MAVRETMRISARAGDHDVVQLRHTYCASICSDQLTRTRQFGKPQWNVVSSLIVVGRKTMKKGVRGTIGHSRMKASLPSHHKRDFLYKRILVQVFDLRYAAFKLWVSAKDD